MDTQVRREEFLRAALELFAQKGFAQTSIRDITAHVGVTRSLFYHYFADKDALTDAIIDWQVDEFMAYVRAWTSGLGGVDIHGSLIGLAQVVRTRLQSPMSFGDLIVREQNAALYQRFVTRSAHDLAEYFVLTRDEKGSLYRITNTCHPYQSFYVLSVGIMSLMIREPDCSNELIADLIADTLHISV